MESVKLRSNFKPGSFSTEIPFQWFGRFVSVNYFNCVEINRTLLLLFTEVRVKQQNAARTKLESQIEDLPSRPTFLSSSGERLVCARDFHYAALHVHM